MTRANKENFNECLCLNLLAIEPYKAKNSNLEEKIIKVLSPLETLPHLTGMKGVS